MVSRRGRSPPVHTMLPGKSPGRAAMAAGAAAFAAGIVGKKEPDAAGTMRHGRSGRASAVLIMRFSMSSRAEGEGSFTRTCLKDPSVAPLPRDDIIMRAHNENC
ncbi:MAG: hypothetical protein M0006_12985, partial [Magnetospirillum sp.]|nr:hypothetical protein [Magnetospirillum sp.]